MPYWRETLSLLLPGIASGMRHYLNLSNLSHDVNIYCLFRIVSKEFLPCSMIRIVDNPMIIFGKMQATLVAFYGKKNNDLEAFISACQNKILETIGSSFLPYSLEQVHGTIIGLEGYRIADKIKNANFESYLRQTRLVDPSALLEFIRSDDFPLIDVKIGGYLPSGQCFESRSQDPYERSFSVQGNSLVAMGWPTVAPEGQTILDDCRRSFNKVNALHKWHRTPTEIDDDFYFVLGQVRELQKDPKEQLIESMRQFLSIEITIDVTVGRNSLSIIGYLDTQLPTSISHVFPVMGSGLTPKTFLNLYSEIYGSSHLG